jgi:hypothetical protein
VNSSARRLPRLLSQEKGLQLALSSFRTIIGHGTTEKWISPLCLY